LKTRPPFEASVLAVVLQRIEPRVHGGNGGLPPVCRVDRATMQVAWAGRAERSRGIVVHLHFAAQFGGDGRES
jgi:hypothetical protein